MTFWDEVLAIFIGDVFASVLLVLLYVMIQWFLRATDVTVSYNWSWKGTDYSPNFDIRNRSSYSSRSYLLANIAYTMNEGKETVWIDNDSLWDEELKPGSIRGRKWRIAPVRGITTTREAIGLEVTVRLQNGRQFWLKGQGPGQMKMGRTQKMASWLRDKLEKAAITLE